MSVSIGFAKKKRYIVMIRFFLSLLLQLAEEVSVLTARFRVQMDIMVLVVVTSVTVMKHRIVTP